MTSILRITMNYNYVPLYIINMFISSVQVVRTVNVRLKTWYWSHVKTNHCTDLTILLSLLNLKCVLPLTDIFPLRIHLQSFISHRSGRGRHFSYISIFYTYISFLVIKMSIQCSILWYRHVKAMSTSCQWQHPSPGQSLPNHSVPHSIGVR